MDAATPEGIANRKILSTNKGRLLYALLAQMGRVLRYLTTNLCITHPEIKR